MPELTKEKLAIEFEKVKEGAMAREKIYKQMQTILTDMLIVQGVIKYGKGELSFSDWKHSDDNEDVIEIELSWWCGESATEYKYTNIFEVLSRDWSQEANKIWDEQVQEAKEEKEAAEKKERLKTYKKLKKEFDR